MEESSLTALFVRPLNALDIPYLVTGGVAAIIYGEPRFTRNIDLVISLHPDNAQAIVRAWPDDTFYVPPLEVLPEESARSRHGHFNIIHQATALRADCYIAGDDPLHTWALERPRIVQVGPDRVRLAPVEYVILRKLSYYQQGRSDRHLIDVAKIVRLSGDLIDPEALTSWLVRLGLQEEWERARDADEK